MMSDVHGEQEFHRNAPATSRASGVPLKTLTLLFALALLLNWADFQDFRPNMDTQTYGILARNLLRSGDWSHLHYTTQAYSDFFQHPPLGIWILAVIFKAVGATQMGLKIASSVFLLGTVALTALLAVFLTRLRPHSVSGASASTAALTAGIILLTCVRYLKPASGYLLDSPLTFFFLASTLTFLWACTADALKRSRWLSLASGGFFVLALLTKGLPALVLPVGFFLLSLALRAVRSRFIPFLIASTLPLGLMCLSPQVRHFAQEYWVQSVAGRVGGSLPLEAHFAPFALLLRTAWPWLPLWIWAAWICVREILSQKRPPQALITALPLLLAGGIVAGFALNGRFLEHYLMPFYPLMAAFGAAFLTPHLARNDITLHRAVARIGAALALAVALLPIHFQGEGHREPIWRLLQEVKSSCNALETGGTVGPIVFAPGSIGRWEGLALGAWVTGRDPWVIQEGESYPALSSAILIRKTDTPAPAQWQGRELARVPPYIAEIAVTAPPCGASVPGSY